MKEVGQKLIKKISYFDKNWSDILQIDRENMDLSINPFLNNMNSILDTNTPFKRVNKYKLRFKTKPCITPALQKSVSVKNSLLNSPKTPKQKNIIILNIRLTEMLSTVVKKKQNELL